MANAADGRRKQTSVITDAKTGGSQEFASRQRKYMITMSVRTILFLGSVILYFTHVINLWVCGILFVAGLLLPTVAVALANEVNTRSGDQQEFQHLDPTDAPQLTAGPEPETVEGTVEDEYGPITEPSPHQNYRNERSRDRGAA